MSTATARTDQALALDPWLAVLGADYLRTFVGEGGSAVKVAVPVDGLDRHALAEAVLALAADQGFHAARVDAAETKVHMVDQVFFAVARGVPWRDLAAAFVRQVVVAQGYALPPGEGAPTLVALAAANGREVTLLRRDVGAWLEQAIYRDTAMCEEFRLAMIALCRAVIEPDDAGRYLAEALDEWLVGELRLVRNLKDALIGQKITRLNARHMLASLARWLRLCGRGGLVLVLDVTRCLDDRAAGGGLAYTAAALLDVYEALRQFIDGADGVDGCLVVVVADERFLTDERRGVHRYDALKSRIWDDVRDRARANPLACLLRVSP